MHSSSEEYLHAVLGGEVAWEAVTCWAVEDRATSVPAPASGNAAEQAAKRGPPSGLTPARFRMLFLNYVKEEAELFFAETEQQQAQAAAGHQISSAPPPSSPQPQLRMPTQCVDARAHKDSGSAAPQPPAHRSAAAQSAPGALDESNFPSLGLLMSSSRSDTVRHGSLFFKSTSPTVVHCGHP